MMPSQSTPDTWIWHPEWKEEAIGSSAGGFVHFQKSVEIREIPSQPLRIQISADTRYKFYINSRLVLYGPVKGDDKLWFYDEVDIQPFLKIGINQFSIRVLRFYYATQHATSFPRLPHPGLLVRSVDDDGSWGFDIQSHSGWETALDKSTRLPTEIKEDDFLHVYEDIDKTRDVSLIWVLSQKLIFPNSHGITAPWKLSPRMIPLPQLESQKFIAIHNIQSTEARDKWENALLDTNSTTAICLSAGTSHHLELEVEHHMTAFLDFRFERPTSAGSNFRVTYSECYEDTPEFVPYVRCKGDRLDTTKKLLGPEDKYVFGGSEVVMDLCYHNNTEEEEVFAPFHFRTLRFVSIDINVTEKCDLVFKGINLTSTHYPLQILAEFNIAQETSKLDELWITSIRTLENCMHDCYEDCPFYEQLQYAMDIRSSALFTYSLSGDDRMARQAIIQLHNSFDPSIGLTASRAPAHQRQVIPHFSLFWICMIADHFEYFSDSSFTRQFLPVCDAVLETFSRRIDPELGLVRSLGSASAQWDFVDWTASWQPMGIPPAAERTGFQAYTNMLYAYTLKRISNVLIAVNRSALAAEYESRANITVAAVQTHCFDGNFFTDGLASMANPESDFSQLNQIWAVLCGAATGKVATEILSTSLSSKKFMPTSTAMAFYTLRALSMVGGNLYNDVFHSFWDPWRAQLAQNLTTWVEEDSSQRSDCHAWGSAPIYEFLAEVAGVRPAAPGWEIITFQPRVSLLPELDAKIPFVRNGSPGIAHVKWQQEVDSIKVAFSLKMDSGEVARVPVRVSLPDREEFVLNYEENATFSVKV